MIENPRTREDRLMRAKQIFECYGREREKFGLNRYCLRCGSRCELLSSDGKKRLTCRKCGFIYYKNPSPGVVVLVIEDDKVLLGKRSPELFEGGKWSLPGGFIEFEEDFLSAAHREVKEETGISIQIISIISVVSNFLAPDLHTLVMVLLARRIAGPVEPGEEMVELKWFPLSGPLPAMAFEADEHIIKRFHETKIAGVPVDPVFSSL